MSSPSLKGRPRQEIGASLTKQQAAILQFIRLRFAADQRMPSYQEISEAFGFSTKGGSFNHVLRLEAKGYVQVDRGIARGIKLTPLGMGVEG